MTPEWAERNRVGPPSASSTLACRQEATAHEAASTAARARRFLWCADAIASDVWWAAGTAGLGIEFGDVVQEARLALSEAARHWSEASDGQFAAWAPGRIRKSVAAWLRRSQMPFSLDEDDYQLWQSVPRAWEWLEGMGCHVTPSLLAEALGTTTRVVERVWQLTPFTSDIDTILATCSDPRCGGDLDHDCWCRDDHPDDASSLALSGVEDREPARRVLALMKQLPDRQQFILRRLYGLGGTAPSDARAVGRELGITECRVEQLAVQAFTALRRTLAADWRAARFRRHVSADVRLS